jgi:hypothetical protein
VLWAHLRLFLRHGEGGFHSVLPGAEFVSAAYGRCNPSLIVLRVGARVTYFLDLATDRALPLRVVGRRPYSCLALDTHLAAVE